MSVPVAPSDLPRVGFRIGATRQGSPDTPQFLGLANGAAGGGRSTHDLFADEAEDRQELARVVAALGDAAWQVYRDPSGLPYDFLDPDHPVYVARGYHDSALVVQTRMSPEVLGQDRPEYAQAGVATVHLVTRQGAVDVICSDVEAVGPAVVGAALGPALMTVLGAVKTFVTSFFTQVGGAAAEGADAAAVAGEAASTAAEEAAVDAEIVGEELLVSVEFGPLAVVGLALAAVTVVFMILSAFLHKSMTAWIRFVNATPYPIGLALLYRDNLSIKQWPEKPLVPARGVPPAPPGMRPLESVVYRADYVVTNDSEWEGFGLTLQAPPDGGFPGLSFMIDVPSVGANSLCVELDTADNAGRFYRRHEGQYTDETMTVERAGLRLSVGTNQTSGKSTSPLGGDEGYFYEYVVVLSTV